jgi:hypothetical protein
MLVLVARLLLRLLRLGRVFELCLLHHQLPLSQWVLGQLPLPRLWHLRLHQFCQALK